MLLEYFGEKESLTEIGIKKSNSAIYEITVVSASITHYRDAQKKSKANIIEKIGLPSFQTDAWENEGDPLMYHQKNYIRGYYIRERSDFEIYAGRNGTTILFSHNKITLNVINHAIVFGFDSANNLCSIQFNGMTLNEEGFLE